MSLYYPSFNYMGVNSLKDKNLIVVHFDNSDSGEMETFLSMESVYTESAYGTRRIDYGARYNSVAVIKITVMKITGKDFTVAEVRDFLRWTTGVRKTSYLDLVEQGLVKFSFLGRVTNVLQHKLDARTIGFTIEFESTSPWAYSPKKVIGFPLNTNLSVDENGVLGNSDESIPFEVDENGVLYNAMTDDGKLWLLGDGVVGTNIVTFDIDNPTDDLYNHVYLDVEFINYTSDFISIKNVTLNEETIINNISKNETINLSAEQFITSDIPNKIFGSTFNFVWPRLVTGNNRFDICCSGEGFIYISYRYPVKIGDCAIDVDVSGNDWCCGDNTDSPVSTIISWGDIVDTPTTIQGYGITDAYNMVEIDNKIINTTVDETELHNMLSSILN